MNLFNMLGARVVTMASDADTSVFKFFETVKIYLNYIMVGIIALVTMCAIIFAIWVAFRLARAEDEQKRKEAKNHLIWTIVGIVGAVLVAVLIMTVFGDGFDQTNLVGVDQGDPSAVVTEVNIVLGIVGSVISIIFNLGSMAAVAFAIYIAYRMAMAQDEQKRKQAKAQLMWTIIAVFAVFVLSAVIGQVMASLSGYL